MSDPSAVQFFCSAAERETRSPFVEYLRGGADLPRVASAFIAMTAEEQGHWSFDAGHLAVEFLRFLLQQHQETRELLSPEVLAQASPEIQAALLSPANHGLRVVSQREELEGEVYEVHVEPERVTLFHLQRDEAGAYERVEWAP